MKQMSKYRWNLVAPKGHILVEDVYLANEFKAIDWVKAYISSWQTWTYTLEKMK